MKFPKAWNSKRCEIAGDGSRIYWWINYKYVRDSFYDDNRQQFL